MRRGLPTHYPAICRILTLAEYQTGGTYDTAATHLRRYDAALAGLVELGSRRPGIPIGQPLPPPTQVFGDIAGTHQRRARAGRPSRERYSQWDARFGWWAMWHSGSAAKVGEYQDLNSSPFWDVDGFSSDGTRTSAVTATGSDQETTQGKVYYYQPGVTAKVDYQRYLHRARSRSAEQHAQPQPTQQRASPNPKVIKDDLGAGQDYAVRVQELKTSVKGLFCDDNVKVRLDVWGLKKEGVRQANAVAMCYTQTATIPPDHPPVQTFVGPEVPRSQPAAADRLDHHGNQAGDRDPPGRYPLRGILPPHAELHRQRPERIPVLRHDRAAQLPGYQWRKSVSVRRGAGQLYGDGPTEDQRPDHGRHQSLRLLDGRPHGRSRRKQCRTLFDSRVRSQYRHDPLVQRHGRAVDEHLDRETDRHRATARSTTIPKTGRRWRICRPRTRSTRAARLLATSRRLSQVDRRA